MPLGRNNTDKPFCFTKSHWLENYLDVLNMERTKVVLKDSDKGLGRHWDMVSKRHGNTPCNLTIIPSTVQCEQKCSFKSKSTHNAEEWPL